MSWTRPSSDSCSYQKTLAQSTSSLDYLLDPNKFYNCNQCRVDLGLFGGNNVSMVTDNQVDVESDLFGVTRQYSKCPERKYLPSCEGCDKNEGLPCGSLSCKQQEKKEHLPECHIIQYTPRIDHVGFDLKYPGCPVDNISSIDGQSMNFQPYFNPIQYQDQQGVVQEFPNSNKPKNQCK